MHPIEKTEANVIAEDVTALRDRIRSLEFQRLVAELAEEHAIREAEASGLPIARRPDARLAVVLADDAAIGEVAA